MSIDIWAHLLQVPARRAPPHLHLSGGNAGVLLAQEVCHNMFADAWNDQLLVDAVDIRCKRLQVQHAWRERRHDQVDCARLLMLVQQLNCFLCDAARNRHETYTHCTALLARVGNVE